ncbi:L protein [mulberry vein banding-associated virus]|uniref:RNA-directed RNA polymerase L n=1 Tax=mulberry vein banding-associated virus TaxID=3071209 RepID=A0A0C5GXN0_9VIRU|nr:L protein [Mulberry vein banding virus]AJP16832.1 L protein [mulberry vein banding-associated virus]
MNIQTINSFLDSSGEITVYLQNIKDEIMGMSNIVERNFPEGKDAIDAGLNSVMSMNYVLDKIEDMKAKYHQSSSSVDQKEMEVEILLFLDKYKELELMRHDLFGALAGRKLHFAPKHRSDVFLKDCLISYIEYCSTHTSIMNQISDIDDLKEKLVFQHLTPDNYTIYKETTGERACLMIYDWKVSVDSMTETKTSENYYTSVWKTFKDITIDGEPFLERHPIFITIVILNPTGPMTITTTTSRVVQELRNSPYKTFNDRRKAAVASKLISVNSLAQLIGFGADYFRRFYSESQAFKNSLLAKVGDYMNRTTEVFFSHWSCEYKKTNLSDNQMSQDVIDVINSIPNEKIGKELLVHFMFGSYLYFKETMSDLHLKDRFEGYKAHCEMMGVVPAGNEEELKMYLNDNEDLFEQLYEGHLEKIKHDVLSKKEKEVNIESIESAFNINAEEYQREYPGCFTNDLQETKTNFSVCWSPMTEELEMNELNYNNAVIQSFRDAITDPKKLIHHKSYGGNKLDMHFSNSLYNLVRTCLVDLSADTTGHSKASMEDIVDIRDGSIQVQRTETSQTWKEIGNVKTRNGNEFTLSAMTSNESRKHFFKGLSLMYVDMGRKRKSDMKNELKSKIQESIAKKEEDLDQGGEYDVSKADFPLQTSLKGITHNKKLIRHDNPDVSYYCKSMIEAMYVLHGMDMRKDRTSKINSVYDEYCCNPSLLFTKGNLIESEMTISKNIHTVAKELSVYTYSEDMMQMAKGLMVADRFMKKTDFKILTCANTSMICLAFKGDGLNTGKSGVPYITVHKVEKDIQPYFSALYTKELIVSFESEGYFINIMRPQRLNQVRLLSLFKSPSKVPILFSQYALLSTEIKKWLNQSSIDVFTCPENKIDYLQKILFSSVIIGTVTKLSRMGIFDFMRYAGFLPLSDYSNIKEYIAEKFDPDITNVIDCFFVSGIKNLLLKMEGINLSNSIKPLTIDQENDMSGGIKDLDIVCPITGSTLKTIECLYNNVYLAIYMMPKSLHTHVHNLTTLLSVPAEWELKFREKMGFLIGDEIKPKKEMFNDSGPFSINGVLNVKTLFDYYRKNIDNVGACRSNIEDKEDFLSAPYKIKTLTSSKKCSKADIIKNAEIVSSLKSSLGKTSDDIKGSDLYILKGVLKCFEEDKESLMNFLEVENLNEAEFVHFFSNMMSGDNKMVMKTNQDKFYYKSHPLTVEAYMKVRYGYFKTTTVLKSKKVSEELYDLIKEFNKITEIDLEALEKLGRGLKGNRVTFIQLLEFVLMKSRTNAGNTDFLVSVFEKMQRTKMDREIYLMSMKTKMMLYFIEHTYKHIAQSDPSEAISISGDYKIKNLASLSYDTITNYNTALQKNLECKMAFLSADQSKWSASDLTYKYVLAVIMNPILTTGEINMMCECIMMYVKLKRVCIPTDIFLNLKRGQTEYGSYGTALSVLTDNLETNTFPVSMNWLQGNLNYLSSVYHSCAMMGYEKAMKRMSNYDFTIRWMVHSDDNATSMVVRGDITKLLSDFNCKNLSELVFRTIQSHFKSYCITLNPKKSYASESEVEFISERIINGAVIPLYCRHLANCSTESSHNSYFDDLMSLSIHVTMLLRKGCPNELIPFAYSAIQVQALSIYSMLPGEENDISSIIKEINFPLKKREIPVCAGGWMYAPVELLSILGPSSNDQLIYYKIMLNFFGLRDFNGLKKNVNSLDYIDMRVNELFKRIKWKTLTDEDKKMVCMVNLFKTSLMSEDCDSLSVGMKFQTMITQIIKLPSFVSENSLLKNSSFKDFCKLFPNLKKNTDILNALKPNVQNEQELNELDESKFLSRIQLEELSRHMSTHPESFLISPMNDKDYILTNLYTYSSVSKRNQMSNQSTEKLALDRILRSKAKTFLDPNSKEMVTYRENMSLKMENIMDVAGNDFKIIRTMSGLMVRDMNFEMIISLMENIVANASIPKANYNFRWFITEKVPSIIEGSPGLIVMSAVYGMDYLTELGLKKLPLTENSIAILHDIFGNRKTFDDVKECVQNTNKEYKTEEFQNSDVLKRYVLSINYMIQSQNKLLSINTCFSRKNFPFYSKYNLGRTFITNTLAIWSTIYSRLTNINFYTNLNFVIDRSSRLIVSLQRDMNLEKLIDCCAYISDRIQSLFPDITINSIKEILSRLNFNGVDLMKKLKSEISEVKRAINNIKTSTHVTLSFRPQMIAMSKHAAWLYNFGYINEKEFKFVIDQIRQSEVHYIKTDEQDIRGYYVSGHSYKIGIKTQHNYAQLAMSNQDISIHLHSPYEFQRQDDKKIWDVHVKSVYKLLQKLLADKQSVLRTFLNVRADLQPNEFCIHESSNKTLLILINDTPRPMTLERIKFKSSLKYIPSSEFAWNLMNNQSKYQLRLAETGECFTELYKTIDDKDCLMKTILSNLKTSLEYGNEMENLIEESVQGLDDQEVIDIVRDSVNQIHDVAVLGLETSKTSEEFETYLRESDFQETVDFHKNLLEQIVEERYGPESRIDRAVEKLTRWTNSLSSFKDVCTMLKFSMINDSKSIKTYKANGADFHSLSSSEIMTSQGFDIFELLKLVKACEACHTSNSVLNLIAFRDIKNKKFIPGFRRNLPNNVHFDYEIKLNNEIMNKFYEYKTISLQDIKVSDRVKSVLEAHGFSITGQNLKLEDAELELNPIDLIDDSSTYDQVSRQMRLTKKKSAYLIPSNTLLLGELMKFLMLCIRGEEHDIMKLLRSHFAMQPVRENRLISIHTAIMTCKISGYIQRHFLNDKKEIALLGISESLENFVSLATPNHVFEEPFKAEALIKKALLEVYDSGKYKILKNIRSYIVADVEFLTEKCLYSNMTSEEISNMIFNAVSKIDLELANLKPKKRKKRLDLHNVFNKFLETDAASSDQGQ